jgi:hypothetical protein
MEDTKVMQDGMRQNATVILKYFAGVTTPVAVTALWIAAARATETKKGLVDGMSGSGSIHIPY